MANKKIFQLIDLDRTLFHTSLFVKLICDMVDNYKPGLGEEIDRRFEHSYKKEETFFALEFIREQLGKDTYAALVEDAIGQIDKDQLLLPGVKERLELAEKLATNSPGYGVFTYSLYPEDQYLKARLIGLDHLPMYISDTADKAQILASWKTDDGTFKLPEEFGGHFVDELTLEDDKLRAFVDLPEGVTGLWLTQRDDAEQRLNEAGVANVKIIRSLSDATQPLTELFA